MSYTLGQYHKSFNSDNTEGIYMTLWGNLKNPKDPQEGRPYPKPERRDGNISPVVPDLGDIEFKDECLNGSFNSTESYYLHCKIKKRNMPQKFYVKLVNSTVTLESTEQFITEINVPGGESGGTSTTAGDINGWYDVDFTFTPKAWADCIWFQLIRTREDYIECIRYPKIVYEELSVINNFLETDPQGLFGNMDTGIIKMGIQSRPHFLMFINKEEIRTDRGGIYELKNGNILINSFSIIGRAKHTNSDLLHNTLASIDNALRDFSKPDTWKDDEKDEVKWESVQSVSLLNSEKVRQLDAYTMDYMYRDKL